MYLHDSSRARLTMEDLCHFPSRPLLDTAMFALRWGFCGASKCEGLPGAGKTCLDVTALASEELFPKATGSLRSSWLLSALFKPMQRVSLLSVTDLLGSHKSGGCC